MDLVNGNLNPIEADFGWISHIPSYKCLQLSLYQIRMSEQFTSSNSGYSSFLPDDEFTKSLF